MAEYGLCLLAAWAGSSALMNRTGSAQGVQADHQSKSKSRWDAAHRDPIGSGIIPMYFNPTEDISPGGLAGEERLRNPSYNKNLVGSVINMLSSAAQAKIRSGKVQPGEHKSEWGVTIDQPVPSGNNPDPLAQIGSSLIPGSNDFTHGNMVPFQKGGYTQDTRAENRAKEGKLELFTGAPKLNKQKQERGLFFQPVANMHHNHGTPVDGQHRDLSRYNPNNTGKKHGESPIEKVRVGPGLGQGYTAEPSGGFHQTLRILPKDITGLRVDPVLEAEARVKSGGNHIAGRTLNPQVYRNRQQLLVENKNGERNFTTVGAVTGRALRPNVVLRNTNRKKSRQLVGGAGSTSYQKARVAPKSKLSTRRNLRHTTFRNAGSHATLKVDDHGRKSYRVKPNNRQTTGLKTHLLGTSGHKKARAYTKDPARRTRKELRQTPRHGAPGHVGTQVPTKGPSYSAEWAPRTTIKETTVDNSHIGFHGQTGGWALPSYNPMEWAARTTIKETTADNSHIGWTGTGDQTRASNYTMDPARTTIKETTGDNSHIGWTGPGDVSRGGVYNQDPARTTIRQTMGYDGRNHSVATTSVKKHIAWNTKERARTTIKETTENLDHFGNAQGSIANRVHDPKDRARTTIRETTENLNHYGILQGPVTGKVQDPKDRARTTIRETTENLNHYGGAGSVVHKKSIAWNTKERARTTIRETTERNNHIGNVDVGSVKKGGAYATSKWDAKNTNRQFTADHEYTGIAASHRKKTKSYDAAYNAETNANKEVIAQGRAPTDRGPNLGHLGMNIQHKKLEDDRKNVYARVKQTTAGNTYNPHVGLTSQRNHLPQESDRLDASLLDAYRRNPLTHSLHSS